MIASVLRRRATVAASVLAFVAAGCGTVTSTPFMPVDAAVRDGGEAGAMGCGSVSTNECPPGLEPWEPANLAPMPMGMAGDAFPETLSFARRMWTIPGTTMRTSSVHARAFIKRPIAAVWAAARDPQTGRDPTASQGFGVRAYNTDPTFAFSYRTFVRVNAVITLMWDVDWRHGVVDGTVEAPLVTAARWQKTMGSSEIELIEGSLMLRAVPGQSEVTEVLYQYHLKAPFSSNETIVDYLTVIFGRLKERAHGRPLVPNDCMDCPTPPAGY
jgi:hypothetical protein